jgi:type II secretory pathway component PulC
VLHKLIVFTGSVLLTLLVMSWQTWRLWQVNSGQFIDNAALKLKATTDSSKGLSLIQIADQHLLGNPADKPVAAPEKPTTLPVTDLKFVLVGAITDSDPAKASALINSEKDTKRYFVGDDIKGQAVLHEVLPDAVVLKRGNRFEKLEFLKAGELNPEAKALLADLKVKIPTQPLAQPPTVPQPQVQQQPGVQGNQEASSAKPDSKPAVEGEKKGRTLRDKLQRRPKDIQKPPGS